MLINRHLKPLCRIFLVAAGLFACTLAGAQRRDVSNLVLDETGAPVPGAFITVKGETRGAMTDNDGRATIQSVKNSDILVAQFLSARKCWECWILWLLINIANIILYISAGLYVMPIVSALYLANGIWSLVSWKRKFNDHE